MKGICLSEFSQISAKAIIFIMNLNIFKTKERIQKYFSKQYVLFTSANFPDSLEFTLYNLDKWKENTHVKELFISCAMKLYRDHTSRIYILTKKTYHSKDINTEKHDQCISGPGHLCLYLEIDFIHLLNLFFLTTAGSLA